MYIFRKRLRVTIRLHWWTKSSTENAYETHITNIDNRFRLMTEHFADIHSDSPQTTLCSMVIRATLTTRIDLSPDATRVCDDLRPPRTGSRQKVVVVQRSCEWLSILTADLQISCHHFGRKEVFDAASTTSCRPVLSQGGRGRS